MSKEYYECHVTFINNGGRLVQAPKGWTFSRIDGDPLFGEGVKSYLTSQFSIRHPLDDVIDIVESAAQYLRDHNQEVIRTKVERVVYDSRQMPRHLESY